MLDGIGPSKHHQGLNETALGEDAGSDSINNLMQIEYPSLHDGHRAHGCCKSSDKEYWPILSVKRLATPSAIVSPAAVSQTWLVLVSGAVPLSHCTTVNEQPESSSTLKSSDS